MEEKDKKLMLALFSELSDKRKKWFKDVAWNLARVTDKYDRLSVYNGLSHKEELLLLYLETEETKKWNEELKIEHEEYIRSFKKDQASSTIKYLFPIGEA